MIMGQWDEGTILWGDNGTIGRQHALFGTSNSDQHFQYIIVVEKSFPGWPDLLVGNFDKF